MNALSTISILSAWIGLTVLNISDTPTAKQVATLFGLVAVGTIVIAVVCHVRNAIGLQVQEASATPGTRGSGSIPPEQGTARRTTPRSTVAAPSPAPSYGTGEISPVSVPEGSKPLAGMSFALTGKMPVKRTKMECLIEYFGGTVHKRIRKDTDFLVMGYFSKHESAKESKASRWNTPTLDVAELAKMIGITLYDIRDRYFEVVPADAVGTRIMGENTCREVRQYNKVAGEQRTLLKSLMEMRPDITLPRPVQVIVSVDEEMELATIDRLKFNAHVGDYILLSTDGEALYLDDLRDCSVSDIIGVLAA